MVHCWASKPKIDLMSEELAFFEVEVWAVRPSFDLGVFRRYRSGVGIPHAAAEALKAPAVLFTTWREVRHHIFKVKGS